MSKESDSYINTLGNSAASYLVLRVMENKDWPSEWVPMVGEKIKKDELHPGITAWPNGIEIRWKTGSVVWYIDFYECNRVANVLFDECAIVLCSIRGRPPHDQVVGLCKDQWKSKAMEEAYIGQERFLNTFPEYKVSLFREVKKKIHSSQVEV